MAAVYGALNTDSGVSERVVTLNGHCGLLLDVLYDKDWVSETFSNLNCEIPDEIIMNLFGAALPCLAQITTAATIQEAVQKFYPFMIEYICDKEDSDNDTQQYILKNLNSLGSSVDFWGRKNDRQHVIDGMSTTQKSQLLCYILRNHEVFGKMTCRDWKNWLLDDAEPQFGIWF